MVHSQSSPIPKKDLFWHNRCYFLFNLKNYFEVTIVKINNREIWSSQVPTEQVITDQMLEVYASDKLHSHVGTHNDLKNFYYRVLSDDERQ